MTVHRWVSGMTLSHLHSTVSLSGAHDCLFIFHLLYLYPALAFSFHDISLFIPFSHALSPWLHISLFFPYSSHSQLLTILLVFLTHLTVYGCFEHIFLFFSNLIFLSLAFLWAYLVSSFTQHWPNLFFCPSTSSPPLAPIQASYLPTYTWFHFCGSFSPDCAVHILANRGGGDADKMGKPSMTLVTT